MIKNCSNCEKRFKTGKEEGCQVFKEKIEKCWAWTDDKEWLEKVNEEVKSYQMGHRIDYQRKYRREKAKKRGELQ